MHPTDALLADLALALGNNDPIDVTTWLDTVEARIEVLSFDPYDDGQRTADDPPWMQEERALSRQILAQPSRYRRVPPLGTPGRLHDFLRSVHDEALHAALQDAARGGRGAYRRVRGLLQARGLESLWHDFQEQADRELALAWLHQEGLLDGNARLASTPDP